MELGALAVPETSNAKVPDLLCPSTELGISACTSAGKEEATEPASSAIVKGPDRSIFRFVEPKLSEVPAPAKKLKNKTS